MGFEMELQLQVGWLGTNVMLLRHPYSALQYQTTPETTSNLICGVPMRPSQQEFATELSTTTVKGLKATAGSYADERQHGNVCLDSRAMFHCFMYAFKPVCFLLHSTLCKHSILRADS